MAIEAGLLSGGLPITCSNVSAARATLTGMQLTGNSTITGTLTVATIISTSITARSAESYVRAYAGSPAQVGTASTGTKLALDQRVTDLSSEYDSTTYTFTPTSTGVYAITAGALGLTAAVGEIRLQLYVNDTLAATASNWMSAGVTQASVGLATTQRLSSGAAGAVQLRGLMASTGRFSSGVATWMDILKVF